MKIIEAKNYEEMSRFASEKVQACIDENIQPNLGLATGSTPIGLYKHLISSNKKGDVSFRNVTTFNLDEYVKLSETDPNSYRYFMNEELFNHVDIDKNNTHVPNGKATDLDQECLDYENKIREAGGIDLQILGIGANGHIGFNEPGTSFQSRTQIVKLDEQTRVANSRFFDSMDDVPTHAITTGIGTIMDSKEIILLISGSAKKEAYERLINGEVSEEFPASVLQNHSNCIVIVDKESIS
ncbi:glucosamine-6-phosphate deaminase [Gracilibacillus halotolerans]|uniref:Glucosamine-6-phosphate deaminase n=1 Tax=Gracilibacillus halotolerans TaxID=74386 RepID=A0A841RN80_9BACI|nr:glucosamine-6-phosphate deaminase [Gracilibacillus halotolerans]MBB6514291.1 glucosamine-6-phosphate deaminase [Gracilibacillus halotolerans]